MGTVNDQHGFCFHLVSSRGAHAFPETREPILFETNIVGRSAWAFDLVQIGRQLHLRPTKQGESSVGVSLA